MDRANENELEYRNGDSGVKYLLRGPNLDWGVIRLGPGDTLAGHYHNETEETFYVTAGTAVFVSGGEEIVAGAGEVLRFEPSEDHGIRNDCDGVVDLVFIKYPYKPEDKVAI